MIHQNPAHRELLQPVLAPVRPLTRLLCALSFCLVLPGSLPAQTPRILAVDEGSNSLKLLDPNDYSTTAVLPLGMHPGIPVEVPSLHLVYVPNRDSNSVTVVDLVDETVMTTIFDPSLVKPVAAARNPSGSEVWIVNQEGGGGSGSISILSTATQTVTSVITHPSLSAPVHIAAHPFEGHYFVVNSGNNKVSAFNPSPQRTFRASVDAGSNPTQVVIVAENNFAFVANNGSGDVTRINRTTFQTLVDFVGGNPRNLVSLLGSIFVTREDRSLAKLNPLSGAVQLINLPVGVATYGLGVLNGTSHLLVGDRNNDRIHIIDASTGLELSGPGLPISGFTNLGAVLSSGIVSRSDLSIVKTDSVDPIRAGAIQTYSLQVANAGPSIAHNVIIEDYPPDNAEFVSAQLPGGSCQPVASGVRCQLDSLAAAGQVTASIQLRLPQFGDFLNQAYVSADEEDGNPGNNQDVESTAVLPSADLDVLMNISPPTGQVGQTLEFDVLVRNLGPSTSGSISFLLSTPPALRRTASEVYPANCQFGDTTVQCNVGSLHRMGEFNLHFTFVAIDAGSFLPVAGVSWAGFDPDESNNSKFVPLVILPADFFTDLAITKTTSTPAVRIGEQARFSISVTNLGPDTDQGVEWTDTIPPGFSYQSLAPGSLGCDLTGSSFRCLIGELPSGHGRTYTIFLRAEEGASGLVRNSVTVSGLGEDSNPANNTGSDVVLVLDSGDFNGDGRVDAADLQELILEINDGDGESVADIAGGSHAGVPQMDLDHNGLVDQADLDLLVDLIFRQ